MSALDELRKHVAALTEATGLIAEVVPEQGTNRIFVLLHKVCLPPDAFRVSDSDVLFIADQMYPLSAIDMFWTEIEVLRADGSVPQGADAIEQYLGRSWRRFSWHRNGIWNPNGNPLLDHFAFVEARLAQEARK